MSPPLAACQCPGPYPCGSAITQEDLLCDLCREKKKTPGAACAAVTVPGVGSVHFAVLGPACLPRWANGDSQ